MKVELINYTQDAEAVLLMAKETRRSDMGNMEDAKNRPDDEKRKELEYIMSTISGPWEFIDYTFLFTGVTRAFTHELVRQRVGVSFAQQSMRIVNKDRFDCLDSAKHPAYERAVQVARDAYREMLEDGVPVQDARGILPTNVLTSIMMKINLRALNSMMNVRLCVRAASEYQEAAMEMRKLVLAIHPWSDRALRPFCMEWGVCKFDKFKGCPLKAKFPWLNRSSDYIETAMNTWEKLVGFSPQPK